MPVTTDEREQTTPAAPDEATDRDTPTTETQQDEVVEELLVEEISIDGMCGVY